MRSPLNKRLFRELRGEFGKYLVIFILMTLTIGMVSGFLVADGSMIQAYEESFEKYSIENGHFRTEKKMNNAQIQDIEDLGIKLYENYYVEEALTNGSTMRIFKNRDEVNKVCLMKGKMPEKPGEIGIDRMYADNNDLSVGDEIESGGHTWKITGLVALSDYSALFSNNNDSMFDSVKFGVSVVCPEEFDSYKADQLNYSYAWKYNTEPKNEKAEKDISEDLMEDVPVFVAEREDGKLKDVSDNGTDAGKWIYNYFQNDPVTGKNEKIIVSVDVSFPYSDEISAAYAAYENYAGWGNGLVVGMIISFVAGILFLLVITLQSGLVCRDREVHTMPADRIPAEVMLAICGMALIGMVGIAGLGLTGSGNPTDGFWLTVITTGEILGAAVFLGAYLSVIRRWKAKKLWRSSFCYTIVKSCKKVYMARTTSGRMIVAFVGLVLMNYLLAALFGGFGLILLFLADGVVLLYMIRENAGRQVMALQGWQAVSWIIRSMRKI